jgi:hypothetical protein
MLIMKQPLHYNSYSAVCVESCYESSLKGLSHEIFGPVFWAVWMYLGLNVNRLWFLNFNDAPLILDSYIKF